MRYKKHFLGFLIFFACWNGLKASSTDLTLDGNFVVHENDSAILIEHLISDRPSPLLHLWRAKQKKSRQTIAAFLAFPLPFGIVGLHRIYLGSAPYVPVAYIASLGGMFGVLPFVDFCVLLMDKKTERYSNNKKIFMWVH